MITSKDVAVSLLFVGTAAAAGYVLRSRQQPAGAAQSKADIGARLVDSVPEGATVVDASSERLQALPSVLTAVERAVRTDAREEWAHVTLEREGSWAVVDALQRSLPYYGGDDDRSGVYVRYGDRLVVCNAIGWARVESEERLSR